MKRLDLETTTTEDFDYLI